MKVNVLHPCEGGMAISKWNGSKTTLSPGLFSLPLEVGLSHGKAPWGRGCSKVN